MNDALAHERLNGVLPLVHPRRQQTGERAVIDDNTNLIDDDCTRCLCDVGGSGYIAAKAIAADGSAHLLLARVNAIGDENVRHDPTCSDVAHEQFGEPRP